MAVGFLVARYAGATTLTSILYSYELSEGRIFLFSCSAGIGVPPTDLSLIQKQQKIYRGGRGGRGGLHEQRSLNGGAVLRALCALRGNLHEP